MMLVSNCCCKAFAIEIYNDNALIDDNYDVILNGTSIGTINNNSNSVTGRIFTDTDHSTKITPDTIQFPLVNNFEPTVAFDFDLLVHGVNTLALKITQNNHNGNHGTFNVGYFSKSPINGKYAIVNVPLDGRLNEVFDFLSVDPPTIGVTRTFNYP